MARHYIFIFVLVSVLIVLAICCYLSNAPTLRPIEFKRADLTHSIRQIYPDLLPETDDPAYAPPEHYYRADLSLQNQHLGIARMDTAEDCLILGCAHHLYLSTEEGIHHPSKPLTAIDIRKLTCPKRDYVVTINASPDGLDVAEIWFLASNTLVPVAVLDTLDPATMCASLVPQYRSAEEP